VLQILKPKTGYRSELGPEDAPQPHPRHLVPFSVLFHAACQSLSAVSHTTPPSAFSVLIYLPKVALFPRRRCSYMRTAAMQRTSAHLAVFETRMRATMCSMEL
jgi:hypothetical protein